MTFSIKLFMREWKEWQQFQKLEQNARSIVFYAEDAATMMYFEPIIKELTKNMGYEICYLTSASDDPILTAKNNKIKAFYIGSGTIRTILFASLKADVLVMTMPDLETFYIKRSKVYPVHYVYVFHSIVSTHITDLKGAFDNYDTILCVGPHHVEEIRATESVYNLKAKNLIEHGYGRLDMLLEEKSRYKQKSTRKYPDKKIILIAPSWGRNGLLETSCGIEIVEILLNAGYYVIVRPHPCTILKWPKAIRNLEDKFHNNPDFDLETDIRSQESFFLSYCMISDWSGVAIEYAFTLERPVIYVDVPKKIRNPHFKDIPCDPFDFSIRNKIGVIVSPDSLYEIPQKIESLYSNIESLRNRIATIRSQTVFNIGSSGVVGAKAIAEIADKSKNHTDKDINE